MYALLTPNILTAPLSDQEAMALHMFIPGSRAWGGGVTSYIHVSEYEDVRAL